MSLMDDDWLAIAGALEKDFEGIDERVAGELTTDRLRRAQKAWDDMRDMTRD